MPFQEGTGQEPNSGGSTQNIAALGVGYTDFVSSAMLAARVVFVLKASNNAVPASVGLQRTNDPAGVTGWADAGADLTTSAAVLARMDQGGISITVSGVDTGSGGLIDIGWQCLRLKVTAGAAGINGLAATGYVKSGHSATP